MMKKYGFLIYISIVLLLGIVTAPLFHNGYMGMWLGGFFKLPFYYHMLWFFAAYTLSVSLHEMAHLIAFKVKKVDIKAIIILCFVFYKHQSKWRVTINLKLLLLGGGMVMPDIKPIHDDMTYYKVAKAVSTSLITAPVFTIVLGSTLFLLNALVLYNLPHMTIFTLFMVLFTIVFTLASNVSTDLMYGDFKAFEKFNKDPLFKLSVITQYVSSLSSYHLEALNRQVTKYPVSDFPNEILPILSTLFEYHVFDADSQNDVLLERAKYVGSHKFLMKRFMRKEIYIPLAQYIIYYLDRCHEDTQSKLLFDTFKQYLAQLKLDDLTKTYLIKQTEHVLGYDEHSVYLHETKNIRPSRFSFVFDSLPDFIESENTHNNGYTRFEKTDVEVLD